MLGLALAATALSRFVLLRHGETDFNALGVIQGSSDASRLSARGAAQADAAGAALARLDGMRIERVCVSPLTRARATLERCAIAGAAAGADATASAACRRDSSLRHCLGQWRRRMRADSTAGALPRRGESGLLGFDLLLEPPEALLVPSPSFLGAHRRRTLQD